MERLWNFRLLLVLRSVEIENRFQDQEFCRARHHLCIASGHFLLDSELDILSNLQVTKSYDSDFLEALGELLKLAQDRDALDTRIAKQKKRVAALYELARPDDESAPFPSLVQGITDACRTVFRAAERPLLPIEVRDRIQALGMPPQSNLLASVHTVLRRLKDSGEIAEVFDPQKGTSVPAAYTWAGKSSILEVMEQALLNAPNPNNQARNRLVEQIRQIKERKTLGQHIAEKASERYAVPPHMIPPGMRKK